MDLFNLSTFLIPRTLIPPLTPIMKNHLWGVSWGTINPEKLDNESTNE